MKTVLCLTIVGMFAVPAKPQGVAPAPEAREQRWNWHVQNTDIVQYHPGFHAAYSGPNSLSSGAEVNETVSLDLLFGARLWRGGGFFHHCAMLEGVGE